VLNEGIFATLHPLKSFVREEDLAAQQQANFEQRVVNFLEHILLAFKEFDTDNAWEEVFKGRAINALDTLLDNICNC